MGEKGVEVADCEFGVVLGELEAAEVVWELCLFNLWWSGEISVFVSVVSSSEGK